MKSPYAAALTLSIWYMLMPPISKGGHLEVNAPLQQWQRGLEFSVKGSCIAELETEIGHAAKDPAATATLSRLKGSICIAEDDPRLRAAKPEPSK
jgi:hypothetical protein